MTCTCPRPVRDLCSRCLGWGWEPGTRRRRSQDDRPRCTACEGLGGTVPHDPECGVWHEHRPI